MVQAVLTLLIVTLLLFGLLHAIPGGPLRSLNGESVGADPAAAEHAEALLGLDRPPLERYLGWLGGVATGDLGTSWIVAPGRPVSPLLWTALVNTLLLTTSALVIALLLGGLIGLVSALRPGSPLDLGLGVTSLVVGGAPT